MLLINYQFNLNHKKLRKKSKTTKKLGGQGTEPKVVLYLKKYSFSLKEKLFG